MIYKSIYSSPLGFLEICSDGGEAITRAYFTSTPSAEYVENALTKAAAAQARAYFEGERRSFELPLAPEGTAFQKQVWHACTEIEYAHSKTFKELAAAIGDDKAARKVALAVEENPIAVFIPDHRVKGKASFLATLSSRSAIKEALLGAEVQFAKR